MFEITNQSFFEQICNFIHHDQENVHTIPISFLEQFTIEQLDNISTILANKNVDIKQCINYVKVYFMKAFSEELSQQWQLHSNDQEKLQNVQNLYHYVKSQGHIQILRSLLLHEMLQLTLKLDMVKEELF